MKAVGIGRVPADVGGLRAYAVLGFISSDLHGLRIGAFDLRQTQAVVWPVSYGKHVFRIGLGTLRGSAHFGLGACGCCAEQHRCRCHENSTHGKSPFLREFWGAFGMLRSLFPWLSVVKRAATASLSLVERRSLPSAGRACPM